MSQLSLSQPFMTLARQMFAILSIIVAFDLLMVVANAGADQDQETMMERLVVALQDGFVDDLVIIRVNGVEIFRKEGVTTKLLLGYADSIEVQVPAGSVNVQIILPSKNLSETIILQTTNVVYLGLSIHEGRIHHRVSNEPFAYL